MARQKRTKHIYHKPKKRAARRKKAGRSALVLLGLAAVLALAYAAGRLLGGADGYTPDEPEAPRYVGTAPFTVAVDAGHGGVDVGAAGYVRESEMAWATAQELLALLEADPNFTPVATRASLDVEAAPAQRAAAANAAGAQLFLSIHGNAADTEDARGFECYPVPPGRERHSQSSAFARLLADEFSAAGQTLRGAAGVRYAYYDGETKLLTEPGGTLYDDLPTFGVLEGATCPAVLAEQCFVTSQEDAAAFGSGEGIRTAARCYYQAICAYFDCEPLPAE